MNPILLELYRHRFAGVAEEMGVTLQRTGFSPNIKERLDFSCALFDASARMVAQASHIPVHLGAMPASVKTIVAFFRERWAQGDVVIVNDPFQGGNHLPDITMLSPVFVADGEGGNQRAQPDFFVASRAHHADVGGMTPGSLPLSTEIYQEGIIIPPVKLYKAGALDEDLQRLILRNVRTPDERRGDLAAQRAAHAVGERRICELVSEHGREEVKAYANHLLAYSERLTRAAIATWPKGTYSFEDVLELVEEGWGKGGLRETQTSLVTIRLAVRIEDDRLTFDFSGTDAAVNGSLNAVEAITQSACSYVIRCLIGDDVPMNEGCLVPVRILTPENSVVNANPPAAVAGGNVETSQRITDVAIGALAQAMPERLPAAAQGTMNNVTIGGKRADGSPYAYYETIGGGMGATMEGAGLSGVQIHMTNTLNTPIEAVEMEFPMRLVHYGLRPDSGGRGQNRGGDGMIREYEILAPATVTVMSERRSVAPWGLGGGEAGQTGNNLIVRADGTVETLPSKFTRRLAPGDRLRIETPGGGGWGQAQK